MQKDKSIISFLEYNRCLAVVMTVLLLVMTGVSCSGEEIPQQSEHALIEKLKSVSTEVRGEKLAVNLLLRAIGRQADVNIIVDESIEDTVSLDLNNMSLYDVFHLVLKTKHLSYYEANNAILVQRETDFKNDLKDVVMVRLCSKYGDVSHHLEELEVVKSEDGNIKVSRDGNCLVVRDHQQNVDSVRELLMELDRPQSQVHIKARIVAVKKDNSRQLGINWGFNDLSRAPETFTTNIDLGVANAATNLAFGFIRDSFLLDVKLSAMQTKRELFMLSSPRIVVLDGEEAEIKQGKEIPYESGTAENRNTSFREAVLSMKVTPKILQNKFLRLNLKVTNDSVDMTNTSGDSQPLINRQEVNTNLFLEDGVTVVVGGILTKGNDYDNNEVPGVSRIPLLGNLFKSKGEKDEIYELLIFITPTIISDRYGFMSKQTLREKNQKVLSERVLAIPDSLEKDEDADNGRNRGDVIIHPIQMK